MLKIRLFILFIFSFSVSLTAAPQKEIKAIIFDCDGVLVDTEYLKFLAWQKALEEEGVTFTLEEYMPLGGFSSKRILDGIRNQKDICIPEEVIAKKNALYSARQKQGVPPIEDMVIIARQLSESREQLGICLGMASFPSHPEIKQNLCHISLEHAFDFVISGDDDLSDYTDPEGTNKPKPYIYLEAAKRAGVSPSSCLVFEDSAAGVTAAADAGMMVIAVPNQYTLHQDFSKAARVVTDYADLKELSFLDSQFLLP